ncbi:MAG: SVM family protein [Candidatus Phytoplasma sp. TWB_XP]
MEELKKQISLFNLFLFICLGLLMLNNNVLYAFPGINLDERMTQLREEQNNLIQQLSNNFNNLNLDNATRLSRMQNISEELDRVSNQMSEINRQLILRDQFQQQTRNNALNQHNNNNNNGRN